MFRIYRGASRRGGRSWRYGSRCGRRSNSILKGCEKTGCRFQSRRAAVNTSKQRSRNSGACMAMVINLSQRQLHNRLNLPPLAGIATMDAAMSPGLSVEEVVRRLKRYHYAFKRLHQILTARITAEPIYELKTGFSLHAWLCAEHVQSLRTRVG